MNKRSALMVAAGLVLAMVVSASAIVMGITGPSNADASTVRPNADRAPVVKTTRETQTVHKKSPIPASQPQAVVVTHAPSAPSTTAPADDTDETQGTSSDDQNGSEDTTEEEWGGDDPSEDPSGEPTESSSESPEPENDD